MEQSAKCDYCGNVHVASECANAALREIIILKSNLEDALKEIDRLNKLSRPNNTITDDEQKTLVDNWYAHYQVK
jgi:hypothetical protein